MTAPTGRRPAGAWFGTVTDAGTPMQVLLDGDDTPAPAMHNGAYSPAVNDRVVVLQVGSQMFAVGKAVQ